MMIVAIVTLYFSYPAASDDKKMGPENKQMAPIIDNKSVQANDISNGDVKPSEIRDDIRDNDKSNKNEVRLNS